MVKAQEYLDKNYPFKKRINVTKLNVWSQGLEKELDLSDFVNLEFLDCSRNQLKKLNLNKNNKLKEVRIYNNEIKDNLSIFSHLTEIEYLNLSNNNFSGSLRSLENCKKLSKLYIANNQAVSGGLEYLPKKLRKLYCKGTSFEEKAKVPCSDEKPRQAVGKVKKRAVQAKKIKNTKKVKLNNTSIENNKIESITQQQTGETEIINQGYLIEEVESLVVSGVIAKSNQITEPKEEIYQVEKLLAETKSDLTQKQIEIKSLQAENNFLSQLIRKQLEKNEQDLAKRSQQAKNLQSKIQQLEERLNGFRAQRQQTQIIHKQK